METQPYSVKKDGASSVELENSWEAVREALAAHPKGVINSTTEWFEAVEKELAHYARWWFLEHKVGVSLKGIARAKDRKGSGKAQHSKWSGLFHLHLKVSKAKDGNAVVKNLEIAKRGSLCCRGSGRGSNRLH